MNNLVKIVVFVPETHFDIVSKAIGDACSFSSKGTGRYKPLEGVHPTIGEVGKLEQVGEERVEFVCPKDKAKAVIAEIKKVHPYEEVVLDIYPLLSEEEL